MSLLRDPDATLSLNVGIALLAFYLAFLPPFLYAIDEQSMLAVAESLVERGSFAVPEHLGVSGTDGQHYSRWYPLMSLLAVPVVWVGHGAAQVVGLPGHQVAAALAPVLSALLTAATGSLVVILSRQLGGSKRGAALAGLSFGLGTIALVYARKFFAEPLLTFFMTTGLVLALGRARPGLLAALCGSAVLAKPAGIVVGPVLFACRRTLGPARAVAALLGTVLGMSLYLGYNHARFDSLLDFGQPWSGFNGAVAAEAVAGLAVSPGRGVLWYAPPVVVGLLGLRRLWKHRRPQATAIALLSLSYLAVHAAWRDWPGGWSWGPRLLLPTFPMLLASASLLAARSHRLLLALTLAGFLVNAPTLLVPYERYYAESFEEATPPRALLWSPLHSPLIRIWGAAARQFRDAWRSDTVTVVAAAGHPDGALSQAQAFRIIPVWWWMLPAVGVSRLLGLGAASLLLLAFFCLVRHAWRNS